MGEAEGQLARMAEEWNAVLASSTGDQAVLADWEQSIDSMRREATFLRDQGRWRGGYRTLMHALGIQHREVYLTAGLAWLLDPDGWHGLGSKVLSGLLVHAGFIRLALAVIWLNDGTLGDHLDDVRALHEAFGPMVADLLVLALHAVGRSDEARRARMSPSPIRPDFFFTFLTSLRAMAIVALNDRDAAEEIYADLLPYRDGPPAGAESISLALRPVAHTLGELALLLGRDDEAAAHFAQAAAIADQWNAPHWSADARTHFLALREMPSA